MSARQCKTDSNRFCYIYGELTFAKEKRSVTSHIKKMYKAYFVCYLGDQDKSWAAHVSCLTRVKTLGPWYAEKDVHMQFGVPVIWREQKDQAVLQQRKRNKFFTQICNQQCAHTLFTQICNQQCGQ